MPTFNINKKGGYETMEVDAYINSLEQQLKEYENKASAINKAIISAQMASDKMIKQANEDTAAVIKKANDESASVLKKANEEAANILKKANEEKDKIMAEAQKYKAALAENADKQIVDIKSTITQQKTLINNFNKEYSELIDKYIKSYNPAAVTNVIKNLDEIDALVSDWQKNGVPEPTGKQTPMQTAAQTPMQVAAHQMNRSQAFGNVNAAPKPVENNSVSNVPKNEDTPKQEESKAESAIPSPLAASSVPKAEEAPKPEAAKNFIKTGLAGGVGMGGIPANPSYGLGGERTLKNSVSHSEAPKAAETVAPEPISPANISVPKFGEAAVTTEEKPEAAAPKPGIYKVSADNHLYNDNNSVSAPANTMIDAMPSAVPANNTIEPQTAPNNASNSAAPKPGIYKVTSDNKLYNDNTDK